LSIFFWVTVLSHTEAKYIQIDMEESLVRRDRTSKPLEEKGIGLIQEMQDLLV